jgi:hypothetical protein
MQLNARRASAIIDEGRRASSNRTELLRRAFEQIDSDGSGTIDIDELKALMQAQGHHNVSRDTIAAVLKKVDLDGDGETLDFEEFKAIMWDLGDGAGLHDILSHFTDTIHDGVLQYVEDAMPLWELMAKEAAESGDLSKWKQFQIHAGMVLDGAWAQAVLLILIAIDVVCVICELVIVSTECDACHPTCVENSRLLGGGAPAWSEVFCSVDSSNATLGIVEQVCTPMFSVKQHDWEHWLHVISVSILGIFALQLFLLMLIYQLDFFKQMSYVADTLVVGAALVLENLSSAKEGGLFIVLLSWRVIRIVHGIVTSVELHEKRTEDIAAAHGLHLIDKHVQSSERIVKSLAESKLDVTSKRALAQKYLEGDTTITADQIAQDFILLCKHVQELEKNVAGLHSDLKTDHKEERKKSMSFASPPTAMLKRQTTAKLAGVTAFTQ